MAANPHPIRLSVAEVILNEEPRPTVGYVLTWTATGPVWAAAGGAGGDFQPLDADLTTIGAIDSTQSGVLATDGGGWIRKTYNALKSALGLSKSDVGLGNVDNTADAAKAFTESQITSLVSDLALKAPLASPTFTGTVVVPNATVTLAMLANETANTFLGNPNGALGITQAMSVAAAKTLLAMTESDVANLVSDLAAKQPLDSDLTTIAGLTATTDNFMVANASAWASRTPAQAKTSLALVKGDVGLGNVDNTSDTNKTLTGDVGGTLGATVIGAAKVTRAMEVNQAANSFRGNNTGSPAVPADLTVAQAKTLLAITEADVASLVSDLALKAPLASPTFTGTVVLPAQTVTRAMEVNQAANSIRGNNTGSAATPIDLTVAQTKTLLAIAEADVANLVSDLALKAPLASPTFTGTPTAPQFLVNVLTGAGVGYGTGAGGTVTQITSRTTGVTLNKLCGKITLFTATLAADTEVTFAFTNSLIAAGDILVFNVVGGAVVKSGYFVNAISFAGGATMYVRNVTPTGSASEAPQIAFAVIKAVQA